MNNCVTRKQSVNEPIFFKNSVNFKSILRQWVLLQQTLVLTCFFLILKKEVGSRIAEGKCRTVLNDQVYL